MTGSPPSPGGSTPLARAAAGLFAAGVVALSLYGLGFLATLPSRLPSPADWRALAERLEREGRAGDAVLLAPWWAERARAVLPGALPVLAFPRLAGEDLPGIRRIWVVALPEAPGGEGLATRDLAGHGQATAIQRSGALALTRVDLTGPVLPLFRLSHQLDTASASLAGRACPRDARGILRCPGRTSPRVSAEVREVDFLPRDCVVVEPGPASAPLALSWHAVPLGRTLRVRTGMVGEPTTEVEAPVEVRIALDGREAAVAEERPRAPGWHRLDVDTSARAGGAASVTVTVHAKRGHPRPICLEGYALP